VYFLLIIGVFFIVVDFFYYIIKLIKIIKKFKSIIQVLYFSCSVENVIIVWNFHSPLKIPTSRDFDKSD
jgi:hypothetical protein